jgi:hypothetical protein
VAQGITFNVFPDEKRIDFHEIIPNLLKKQFQINGIIARGLESDANAVVAEFIKNILKLCEPSGVVDE